MTRRSAVVLTACLLVATSADARSRRRHHHRKRHTDDAEATTTAPVTPPATPAPPPPPPKPVPKPDSVAVMNTVAEGVSDTLAALTAQTISSYAQNNLGMDVISKDDVRKLVTFEQMRALTGCDTGTCAEASDLGGALGVRTIITSTLGKIGSRLQLTVVAMDVPTAKAIGRGTRELRSEDEIVENARDLTHWVLKHEQRESKGYARITVSETAAQIAIDGAAYGVSPLAVPARLLAGHHTIHIEKEGYLPFDGGIDVQVGKESDLDIKLIAKRDIKVAGAGFLPWAGATGGIAIVGAAVSIVSYYHALNICKAYSLDSSKCAVAGKNPIPVDLNTLNNKKNEVDLYGNKIAFYGAIGSGILGAASVALFTAYFIAGAGAGGDEPKGSTPFHVIPTGDGFAVHF